MKKHRGIKALGWYKKEVDHDVFFGGDEAGEKYEKTGASSRGAPVNEVMSGKIRQRH